MIRGLDSQAELFLANMKRIEQRQQRVQAELSSGLRVSKPSDAPDRVMNILQLRSEISRATVIGDNLIRATADVDSAEAAVRNAVQLVERARVLAAQGATGTAPDRGAMAIEAKQLHEQLVNLTFTASEGRLVFSGDLPTDRLYAADWSQPGGITRLETAANTRQLEDINGSRFSISRTAHEVFDARDSGGVATDENVFNAVYSLGKALEADDRDAVEDAAGLLVKALDHLGRQTTFYGHAQNRVDFAVDLNKTSIIARQKELGVAQDADIAEALVELNLAKVHQQAALSGQSQMPRASLFDYLG